MGALLDSLGLVPQDFLKMTPTELRRRFSDPVQQRTLIAELDAFELPTAASVDTVQPSLSTEGLSSSVKRTAAGALPGSEPPFQFTDEATSLPGQIGESALNAARMVGNIPSDITRQSGNLFSALAALVPGTQASRDLGNALLNPSALAQAFGESISAEKLTEEPLGTVGNFLGALGPALRGAGLASKTVRAGDTANKFRQAAQTVDQLDPVLAGAEAVVRGTVAGSKALGRGVTGLEGLATTTGTDALRISREAGQRGGRSLEDLQAFRTEALKGGDLVRDAADDLRSVERQLGQEQGAALKQLRSADSPFDLGATKRDLAAALAEDFDIEFTAGTPPFTDSGAAEIASRGTPINPASPRLAPNALENSTIPIPEHGTLQPILEKFFDRPDEITAREAVTLRQSLDKSFREGEASGVVTNRIASRLRSQLKETAPELTPTSDAFASFQRDLHGDPTRPGDPSIARDLGLRTDPKFNRDTARSKLQRSLRENTGDIQAEALPLAQERIGQAGPGRQTGDLEARIAGMATSPGFPQGLGRFAAMGVAGGIGSVFAGLPAPLAIAIGGMGLASTSPRLVGRLFQNFGQGQRRAQEVINGLNKLKRRVDQAGLSRSGLTVAQAIERITEQEQREGTPIEPASFLQRLGAGAPTLR